MFKKILAAACIALLTQGCAGNSDKTVTAAADTQQDSNLICNQVRTTGSMLKGKRCRTKEQLEAEREEARNTVNTMHSAITGTTGTQQ